MRTGYRAMTVVWMYHWHPTFNVTINFQIQSTHELKRLI